MPTCSIRTLYKFRHIDFCGAASASPGLDRSTAPSNPSVTSEDLSKLAVSKAPLLPSPQRFAVCFAYVNLKTELAFGVLALRDCQTVTASSDGLQGPRFSESMCAGARNALKSL